MRDHTILVSIVPMKRWDRLSRKAVESARTTKLYDWRSDKVTLDEVEKITFRKSRVPDIESKSCPSRSNCLSFPTLRR